MQNVTYYSITYIANICKQIKWSSVGKRITIVHPWNTLATSPPNEEALYALIWNNFQHTLLREKEKHDAEECCNMLCCHCFSVAQLCLTLCDPMDCGAPGFLSFTISRSLLKLMSIESVMPSNHFIVCRSLLLLPSVFPSIRAFSNKSVLAIIGEKLNYKCVSIWIKYL